MTMKRPGRRQCLGYGNLVAVLFLGVLLVNGANANDREWRPAVVSLSDGTRVSGEVTFTQNSLNMFHAEHERRYDVPVSDMKKLETLIERQYMDEKWIFREDGRDEKVYTGDKYPIRRLTHRVTFGDGSELTGKIHGRSFYLRDDKGKVQRFALKRKLEGEVGDQLEDLVYVKSIIFQDKAKGVLGMIHGTVFLPRGEELITVVALNRTTDLSLKAQTNRQGRFIVKDAMAGTYDLFIITGEYRKMGGKQRPDAKKIYCYISREKELRAIRLNAGIMKKIEDWKKNVRSVFDVERPIYGAGDPKDIYVLTHMERTSKLAWSFPEQWEWVGVLKRFEIWRMKKQDDDWEITKRHFVHRELIDDAKDPAEQVVVDSQLGGHKLNADNPKLKLTFELGPTDEEPIPPGKAK